MILYPAIDLRGRRAVRLVQGDYDRETEFDPDPVRVARRWVEQGAQAIHVVDLDGARAGNPQSLDLVEEIVDQTGVPIQFGGGLRTAESIDAALATGVERVVLGTIALTDPALVESMVAEHGGSRVVVAADSRDGHVAVEGWERPSNTSTAELIADLGARGVGAFLFTPVEVDGTLQGPAIDELEAAAEAAGQEGAGLVYSGGVGSIDHLRTLSALELPSLEGVVVGRALYEGRFTVGQGREALGS